MISEDSQSQIGLPNDYNATKNIRESQSQDIRKPQEPCRALEETGNICAETQTLKILNEFKKLYEDRLRKIDTEGGGDIRTELKLQALQEWVHDLGEQNTVLVQTVEELEREATERVAMLENKLQQSSFAAKDSLVKLQDYDAELQANLDKQQQKLTDAEEEIRKLKDQVIDLENDIANLLELIRRARETGKWDVQGLNFKEVSYDDLFSSPVVADSFEAKLREAELQIVKLKSDLQEAQKKQKIAEQESEQSRGTISNLQSEITNLSSQVSLKDSLVKEQSTKVKDLNSEMEQKQLQVELAVRKLESDLMESASSQLQKQEHVAGEWKRKADDAIEKAQKIKMELNRAEDELKIKDMQIEDLTKSLRAVDTQFNIASDEKEKCEEELQALQSELAKKTLNLEDMKQSLDFLEKSARDTRDVLTAEVAQKHDQILAQRKEIQVLEDRWKQASMQTQFKDDIIKEMRKEIKQSRSKISYLELELDKRSYPLETACSCLEKFPSGHFPSDITCCCQDVPQSRCTCEEKFPHRQSSKRSSSSYINDDDSSRASEQHRRVSRRSGSGREMGDRDPSPPCQDDKSSSHRSLREQPSQVVKRKH